MKIVTKLFLFERVVRNLNSKLCCHFTYVAMLALHIDKVAIGKNTHSIRVKTLVLSGFTILYFVSETYHIYHISTRYEYTLTVCLLSIWRLCIIFEILQMNTLMYVALILLDLSIVSYDAFWQSKYMWWKNYIII